MSELPELESLDLEMRNSTQNNIDVHLLSIREDLEMISVGYGRNSYSLIVSLGFVSFLMRFGREFYSERYLMSWRIPYNYFRTAYRVSQKNPKKFEEILETAERAEDFMALVAIV